MLHQLLLAAGTILIGGVAAASTVPAADKDTTLVKQGEYIARASDCISCHVGPDGVAYAGGKPIATPLGDVIASNISASKKYGIGEYSVKDLTNVLRNGKTPSGSHLYPAMPYPAYRGMTDDDIKALHAYLQTVPAVEHAPEAKTDLAFPFNFRFLMIIWNTMNLDAYDPPKGLDGQVARGQYIVDNLAHCGTCHTPRNDLMGSDHDQYLGGAQLGRWFAPNITSDHDAGIGAWSDEQLAEYFKNGQVGYSALAAGPMAEAIHYSLQHLTEGDRLAMAAYLKTVRAIANDKQSKPTLDTSLNEQLAGREPMITKATRYSADRLAEHGLKPGDIKNPDSPQGLYAQHCASCHSDDGYGQPVSYYASLNGNATLRNVNPRNLVAVILDGVAYRGATPGPLMPGFDGKLDRQQIAAVSNFVRTKFGGHSASNIDADQVAYIASGKQPVSALIRYAPLMAWLGVFVAVLAIAGGLLLLWRWRHRKVRTARIDDATLTNKV
jgi:mono/diheme cytochrome c family protein